MEILVVEDDATVRTAFTKALTNAGFSVSTADNGLSALESLKVGKPAFRVIVCDLQMPTLDGIGLYRRLRADSPQWADRVLFVTASARDEPTFLREAGRPYLIKPVDLSDLIGTVRQLAGPKPDRRAGDRRQAERRQRSAGFLMSRRETSDRRSLARRLPPG